MKVSRKPLLSLSIFPALSGEYYDYGTCYSVMVPIYIHTYLLMPFHFFPDRSYILGNAHSPECAIIYCSDNFCRLSGFSRAEVMQKSSLCTFLHGPLTSLSAVTHIQQSLLAEEERHLEVLYYKKDGKPRNSNSNLCFHSTKSN